MPVLSGAQIVVNALKACGVDLVVGITGHTIMEVIDELCRDETIRAIYARNEVNGAFILYGYNRFLNRTRGVGLWHVAGAPHISPCVISASLDKVPMVHICGNVLSEFKGKSSFQETKIYEMFLPISKWAFRIERTDQIPTALIKAIITSESGMPGPCILDVPFDHFVNKIDIELPKKVERCAKPAGDETSIKECCEIILKADRPVILAGRGVICSEACSEVQELAELLCIPVISGQGAKGCISEEHPLALGIPGFNGWRCANEYMEKSDCWIAIGLSFNQFDTQEWNVKTPANLIHIDVEPTQIGKIYPSTIGIVGDAKLVLQRMIRYLKEKIGVIKPYQEYPRFKEISEMKSRWMNELLPRLEDESKPMSPFRLIKEIRDIAVKFGATVVTDSSCSYEFSSQAMIVKTPQDLIYSHNYSCLGAGFPAAIGVKLASPNKPVICLTGDGGFHYSFSELAVCTMEKIPVVTVIMNNGWLNTNKMICDVLFGKRRYWVRLNNPDWVQLAKSFGVDGVRVESPEDLRKALREALNSGTPYVIDAITDDAVPIILTGRPWKVKW